MIFFALIITYQTVCLSKLFITYRIYMQTVYINCFYYVIIMIFIQLKLEEGLNLLSEHYPLKLEIMVLTSFDAGSSQFQRRSTDTRP